MALLARLTERWLGNTEIDRRWAKEWRKREHYCAVMGPCTSYGHWGDVRDVRARSLPDNKLWLGHVNTPARTYDCRACRRTAICLSRCFARGNTVHHTKQRQRGCSPPSGHIFPTARITGPDAFPGSPQSFPSAFLQAIGAEMRATEDLETMDDCEQRAWCPVRCLTPACGG